MSHKIDIIIIQAKKLERKEKKTSKIKIKKKINNRNEKKKKIFDRYNRHIMKSTNTFNKLKKLCNRAFKRNEKKKMC